MRGSWDDRNAFVSWVDEHAGFDDAMVRRIEPVPGEGGAPPDTVALEIARQVGGGLHAGETRRLSRFLLRCHGVSRFAFVPGRLVIECARAEAEELPDVEDVVQPWESDLDVFLTFVDDVPTADEVVRRCAELVGIPLVWRVYSSEATPDAAGPLRDRDGWFLQRPERVAEVNGGVMVGISSRRERALTLSNRESGDDMVLWAAVLETFSSFAIAEAQCGNRTLDAAGFRDLAARRSRQAADAWALR